MPPGETEAVLVMSPRYANDVAMGVQAAGMTPRVERQAEEALARFRSDPMRVAVVDARGALDQGLALVRALGPEIERQKGGLLALLSRGNAAESALALDAGATSVLVSPFNSNAFGNALRLTARNAEAPMLSPQLGAATRDPLTGLATGDALQQWLDAQQLPDQPVPCCRLAVIALSVGRIGAINAAYGRSVADEALRSAAVRLAGIVNDRLGPNSENWLLARLAAEFALGVAGDAFPETITRLSHQLVAGFATPFIVAGREIHLTARIGFATAGGESDAPSALIRRATAALAVARAGEPGTISSLSSEADSDDLLRRADLVGDLHRAMDNEDITLMFQPVLDFASGQIAVVEALVRWDHPVFGLLDAETLLETAAAAELAVRLGRHIRSRAMAEVMAWPPSLAGLRLALNITAADLADPGFVDWLESALAISGMPKDRLTLEITEGALIDNIAEAAIVLDRLRQSGINVVLDDFGTGFSSLAWLARLPLDGIKLDRSFTRAMGGTTRERIVVETVVALARRLGMTVVAEGVEEPAQLGAAFAAGCNAVQGFEIAMPLSSGSLVDFCATWVVTPGGKSS